MKILRVEAHWFNYCPSEAYEELQRACKGPLEIFYFDDEKQLTLLLPETKDFDGEYVSNSITVKLEGVELVS